VLSTAHPDGNDLFRGAHDEFYPDFEQARDRVFRLVLSNGVTTEPEDVRLAELRASRNLSQEEHAASAGIGQANISRIENGDDILMDTLENLVAALGAKLVITIQFPAGDQKRLAF
jgi:DNA-binding Xre family transcriptional regulator